MANRVEDRNWDKSGTMSRKSEPKAELRQWQKLKYVKDKDLNKSWIELLTKLREILNYVKDKAITVLGNVKVILCRDKSKVDKNNPP